MAKQNVFLVGATGETGAVMLDALIKDGSFNVTCFIRSSSAGKPAVKALEDRGLKIVKGDLAGPIEETVALLQGIDIVVSALFPLTATDQLPLVDAAAKAGVKRFLPCNWGTIAPRGGIMDMRDLKEEVHDCIFRHRLGFTIIDVGFWYQISYPRVPSGKFDYASFLPINEVYAGGTAPNLLIDKRDIGTITVKIMKDERTLNKRVYIYGEVLSQNEVNEIVEQKTGEKLDLVVKSTETIAAEYKAVKEAYAADQQDMHKRISVLNYQYIDSKYVREDNTAENAEYLGYINGRELYPDFQFIKFADFVDDLTAGKIERPYPHLTFT
ncbi:hypothetical protein F5884DRAFT_704262 [Xylogone sp. PMI_703]|nr:hypothetical protein F5884DRAFT_704262 [Xylogone sp. PMI_703]